jgi:hypothetical protein
MAILCGAAKNSLRGTGMQSAKRKSANFSTLDREVQHLFAKSSQRRRQLCLAEFLFSTM